jgi:hypothetical protein
MSDSIEQIVSEARKGFDLKDRLEDRTRAEGTHTVFTDDKLAKQVVETATAIAVAKSLSVPAVKDANNKVLAKEVKPDQKLIAELTEAKAKLVEELRATSFTFHFSAVRQALVDRANAQAKAKLAENPDDTEASDAYFFAILFADAVTKVEDHAAGESATSIDLEDALALRDELEPGEWLQLNAAFNTVQFQNSVAHQITDSPDF